jgi:hypothetical protein
VRQDAACPKRLSPVHRPDAERAVLPSRRVFLLCLYRDLRLTSGRFKITCVICLNPVDFWQLKLSSPDFTEIR